MSDGGVVVDSRGLPVMTEAVRPAPAVLVPGPGGKMRELRIPVLPSDPGYLARIPPPEPDGSTTGQTNRTVAPSAPLPVGGTTQKRVVVSFGKREGQVIVGVESAPDWDMDEDPLVLDLPALRQVLPVLRQLGVKVKNLVGADLYE